MNFGHFPSVSLNLIFYEAMINLFFFNDIIFSFLESFVKDSRQTNEVISLLLQFGVIRYFSINCKGNLKVNWNFCIHHRFQYSIKFFLVLFEKLLIFLKLSQDRVVYIIEIVVVNQRINNALLLCALLESIPVLLQHRRKEVHNLLLDHRIVFHFLHLVDSLSVGHHVGEQEVRSFEDHFVFPVDGIPIAVFPGALDVH